jgi:hypothetical protein
VRRTDEYNHYTYGFRLYDAGPEQNHPLGAIESASEEEAVVNSPKA